MKQLIIAIKVTLVFALLTGVAYPLLVNGLARVLFPHQAQGSFVAANGKIVGSELIGQRFTRPEYFHGRPSAAGNGGYDSVAPGGSASNYGPTNQKLIDRVQGDVKSIRAENPGLSGPIPADMVTTSASGIDPHVSPASAEAQVARVAAARGMSADAVHQLVTANTEGRQLG